MVAITYFRHKVAITLTLFSAFLSFLFCILILIGLQKSDDHVREALLASHAERLQQYYAETGQLWGRSQLSGIDVLVEGRDPISSEIGRLSKGYHEQDDTEIYVYVDVIEMTIDEKQVRVFLIHNALGTDAMEEYEPVIKVFLGIVTVLVTVIGSVIGIILSNKISQPVQTLSERVKNTDPNAPAFEPLQRKDEFGEISNAFASTLGKINQVIVREKQFSRYASHELRTPVAVINSSLGLWTACDHETDQEKSAPIRKRIFSRIKMASQQMEDVIQTFLLLGKDNYDWKEDEYIDLSELLDHLIDKYHTFHASKSIQLIRRYESLNMNVKSETAVSLVLSNALRNAFDYSASQIEIVLEEKKLTITNDIDALRIDEADHFGFGLKIIQDLCEILGWGFNSEQSGDSLYTINIFLSE